MSRSVTTACSSSAGSRATYEGVDAPIDRELLERLFPLMRTSVGPSIGRSLEVVSEYLPLSIDGIPSGESIGDWTVPDAWEVSEAFLIDPSGKRMIDLANHSLHVVNGSVSVDAELSWDELQSHLFHLPNRPEAIPYRTAYYEPSWGFCLSHRQWCALQSQRSEGKWRAVIRSTRSPGMLQWGSWSQPGASETEFLFTAHLCHPSLANDNLSGVAVAVALGRWLATQPRRWSYRILFGPGTIGPIAWHSKNREAVRCNGGGAVLAMVGDSSPLRYKQSLTGTSLWDQVCAAEARQSGELTLESFVPEGYDERQFNSVGIGCSMGRLSRADWRTWPEYHSSDDNLEVVSDSQLAKAVAMLRRLIERLESIELPQVNWGAGEPRLGRHGLWNSPITQLSDVSWRQAVSWLTCCADGKSGLDSIALRAGIDKELLQQVCEELSASGLLTWNRPAERVNGVQQKIANEAVNRNSNRSKPEMNADSKTPRDVK